MEQEKQGVLTACEEIDGKRHQATETHELDPNSCISGPELDSNEYPSPYELETSVTSNPYLPASRRQESISRKPVPPVAPIATEVEEEKEEEEDEEGMRILQDRIERIRGEKERLQKIQDLELLEEETKRAILEKARQRGDRNGSGGGNG
jgi:hypothetical protein